MDIIREHLMYKNSKLTICLKSLTPQEQYECIRVLLESGKDNVSICIHNSANVYIKRLLNELKVSFCECSEKPPLVLELPL
jgi:hypothetical protein